MVEADGETVLDWKQALEAALQWFQKVQRPGFLEVAELTIQTAVDEYSAMRDARDSARAGRPVRSDGRSRLTRLVKVDEELAGKCLYELTEADLKGWRKRIQGLKVLSRQRLANDLKAALNYCYENHRRSLPTDFPVTVKFGLKPEEHYWELGETRARDNQILGERPQLRISLPVELRDGAGGPALETGSARIATATSPAAAPPRGRRIRAARSARTLRMSDAIRSRGPHSTTNTRQRRHRN